MSPREQNPGVHALGWHAMPVSGLTNGGIGFGALHVVLTPVDAPELEPVPSSDSELSSTCVQPYATASDAAPSVPAIAMEDFLMLNLLRKDREGLRVHRMSQGLINESPSARQRDRAGTRGGRAPRRAPRRARLFVEAIALRPARDRDLYYFSGFSITTYVTSSPWYCGA
jgi:hypothetical protein